MSSKRSRTSEPTSSPRLSVISRESEENMQRRREEEQAWMAQRERNTRPTSSYTPTTSYPFVPPPSIPPLDHASTSTPALIPTSMLSHDFSGKLDPSSLYPPSHVRGQSTPSHPPTEHQSSTASSSSLSGSRSGVYYSSLHAHPETVGNHSRLTKPISHNSAHRSEQDRRLYTSGLVLPPLSLPPFGHRPSTSNNPPAGPPQPPSHTSHTSSYHSELSSRSSLAESSSYRGSSFSGRPSFASSSFSNRLSTGSSSIASSISGNSSLFAKPSLTDSHQHHHRPGWTGSNTSMPPPEFNRVDRLFSDSTVSSTAETDQPRRPSDMGPMDEPRSSCWYGGRGGPVPLEHRQPARNPPRKAFFGLRDMLNPSEEVDELGLDPVPHAEPAALSSFEGDTPRETVPPSPATLTSRLDPPYTPSHPPPSSTPSGRMGLNDLLSEEPSHTPLP